MMCYNENIFWYLYFWLLYGEKYMQFYEDYSKESWEKSVSKLQLAVYLGGIFVGRQVRGLVQRSTDLQKAW